MLDKLPRRIEANLSVQTVGEETLVYVESRRRAFCLNRPSALVWNLCDGTRTVEQIVAAANEECAEMSEGLVRFALHELRQNGLLNPARGGVPQLSRRQMMAELGARALAMLPLVATVLVPKAAQAVSGIVDGKGSGPVRALRARRRAQKDDPLSGQSGTSFPWPE